LRVRKAKNLKDGEFFEQLVRYIVAGEPLSEEMDAAVRGVLDKDGRSLDSVLGSLREQHRRSVAAKEEIARKEEELAMLNAKFKSTRVGELRGLFDDLERTNAELRQQMTELETQNAAIADQLSSIMDQIRKVVGVPPVGHVTLCFSDVQGSTSQWEMHSEVMEKALALHNEAIRRCIDSMGGYEVKTEGDAFMVAFDSPLQAVKWALVVQDTLLEVDWPPEAYLHADAAEETDADGRLLWRGLRVRIGLHCGEPTCRPDAITGRMDYFGKMVNKAARVEGGTHGGQVVISEDVFTAVREDLAHMETVGYKALGSFPLKGIDGETDLFQIFHHSLAGRLFPAPFQKYLPAPTGTVTLVFTDVQGSTSQWEMHANIMAKALVMHNQMMRKYIKRYQGYEVRTEGDAFMVTFAKATQALNWCMATQEALMELPWPAGTCDHPDSKVEVDAAGQVVFRGYRVRMGVHTGVPVCEKDATTGRMGYQGKMVTKTGCIEGLTYGAQINMSSATWNEARENKEDLMPHTMTELGIFEMSGLDEKDSVYQIMPKALQTRTFPSPRQAPVAAKPEGADAPTGVVTLCNTDVQGSTTQWEMHPTVMYEGLAMHNKLMRQLIAQFGGYEIRTEGDAFFVAFSEAAQALNWAITVQEELMRLPWPERLYDHPDSAVEHGSTGEDLFRGMRVRIGIHTGKPICEVDPRTGRMDYFGPTVDQASTVEHASHGGQIVVSEEVLSCIASCGALSLQPHRRASMGRFMFGPQHSMELVQVLPEHLAERTFKPTPILHLRAAPVGDVTIVYTDVKGSTTQWEMHANIMERSLAIHNDIMRARISEHGGYEVKTEGDAFMVSFGSPVQAVRWALDVQVDLLRADWPEQCYLHPDAAIEYEGGNDAADSEQRGDLLFRGLRVRVGIHTGHPRCEPDPITSRMDYFGNDVHRAAGVEGAAQGGQILVSAATWAGIEGHLEDALGSPCTRSVGSYVLKGLKGEETLHEVLPRGLAKRKFAALLQKPKEMQDLGGLSDKLLGLQSRNETLQGELNRMETSLEESSSQLTTLRNAVIADQAGDMPEGLEELTTILQTQAEMRENLRQALAQQRSIRQNMTQVERAMASMFSRVADSFAAKSRIEEDLNLWRKKQENMAAEQSRLEEEIEALRAAQCGEERLRNLQERVEYLREANTKEEAAARELQEEVEGLGDYPSLEEEDNVLETLEVKVRKLRDRFKTLQAEREAHESDIAKLEERLAELGDAEVDEEAVIARVIDLERQQLHLQAKLSIVRDQTEEINAALNRKRATPEPLNDFWVDTVGPTMSIVKWKPPRSPTKITSYAMYLREFSAPEYKLYDSVSDSFVKIGEGKSIPGTDHKLQLNNLSPETVYEVKMRASNQQGWGGRSIRSVKFSTLVAGAEPTERQRKRSIVGGSRRPSAS